MIVTIIIVAIIAALVFLAIRRVRRRGMCDCNDCASSPDTCAACGGAERMVADMEAANKADKASDNN